MASRVSIDIPGLSHLTAIPVASKVGPLLISSVIAPFDPGTRDVPAGAAEQLTNIFGHVDAMLTAGGAAWGDVAKMNFWVTDAADRPAIEPLWIERFPDPTARPARHTQIVKGAPFITADFLAYIGG